VDSKPAKDLQDFRVKIEEPNVTGAAEELRNRINNGNLNPGKALENLKDYVENSEVTKDLQDVKEKAEDSKVVEDLRDAGKKVEDSNVADAVEELGDKINSGNLNSGTLGDIFYPSNPKLRARAIELETDCRNYELAFRNRQKQ
jgi:hypothetical protein